jgi:hypothetical protein
MQCEIAAAYMSGNLRHTKQLISELTVPTTGHPLRPDALAVEARVCDRTVVPQYTLLYNVYQGYRRTPKGEGGRTTLIKPA